jgi:hypothetical protein
MAWFPEQQFKEAEFGVGESNTFASSIHLPAIGVDH